MGSQSDGVSISLPPGAAPIGASLTIERLDPASAPELPLWADGAISAYDFKVDRPLNGLVTIRIPLPDAELAILGHYHDGRWEAIPFKVDGNVAVVEVEELSLFPWLNANVVWLSDKMQDFLTLSWLDQKPSCPSEEGVDVDESRSLGLITGCVLSGSEDEIRVLVQNIAPLHLDIYPLREGNVRLVRTSIWASAERNKGMVVAPNGAGEWGIELSPGESAIFEAYFSDSAIAALVGDLIPIGRFGRGIIESSLFSRDGREMTWGDVKGLLVIPAFAEWSKQMEEIPNMALLERGQIIFTYHGLPAIPLGMARVGDFSVAPTAIDRQQEATIIQFAITKVAETRSGISATEVVLTDDHGNKYETGLVLLPDGIQGQVANANAIPPAAEFLDLLPMGFTYVKGVTINIPGPAPIVSMQLGESGEIPFDKVKLVEPPFTPDFGLMEQGEPVSVEFLTFVAEPISPDLHTWAIPVFIENRDYNKVDAGLQVAVQYSDGTLEIHPGSAERISVSGLSENATRLMLLPLWENATPEIRMLLLFYSDLSSGEWTLRLWRVSGVDLPPRVGQGLGGKEDLFIDAYQRNGGQKVMGEPLDLPHWYGGGNAPKDTNDVVIQEFPRVSEFGKSDIVWDKNGNATKAYVVHGAILDKYSSIGGPYHKPQDWKISLGAPIADEAKSIKGYPLMNFNGGYITTPDGVNFNPIKFPTGKIILDDSKQGIWTLNTDSEELRRLTFANPLPPSVASAPASLSPDGKLVAYVFYYRNPNGFPVWEVSLRIGDMNGNLLWEFPRGVNPAWSQDGTKLAFVGLDLYPGLGSHIYALEISNKELKKIADFAYPAPGYLAWSPDGRNILYVNRLGGSTTVNGYMYSVAADGSGLVKGLVEGNFPSWSPKGDKIAFVKNTGYVGDWEIYIMNSDGSGITLLTKPGSRKNVVHMAWAPDGESFAVVLRESSLVRTTDSELYLIRPGNYILERVDLTLSRIVSVSWVGTESVSATVSDNRAMAFPNLAALGFGLVANEVRYLHSSKMIAV